MAGVVLLGDEGLGESGGGAINAADEGEAVARDDDGSEEAGEG